MASSGPMPQPVPEGYGSLAKYSGPKATCTGCGGGGCAACAGTGSPGMFAGILANTIASVLPYSEGGRAAPRWYDVTLDAMYLTREEASRRIDLSSDGPVGPILLSTSDMDFEEEIGFRLTGAAQIFAGSTLEFTYFGLFNWSTAAANRPSGIPGDNVFSVLSNFGTINAPNGFDETDRARQHTIAYSSTIDNFELHVRKRWQAPNARVQGSWLLGARYLYLLEDFNHFTLGGGTPSRGNMNYDVRTRNSLTGGQIGGDMWINLIPGVNVGADFKVGAYGNYANQSTRIVATTGVPPGSTFAESLDSNDIALISEANVMFLYRLGPHFTFKGGYSFLFIEGVALAPENFNTTVPTILFAGSTRTPFVNVNGNIFYHGAFAGLEWMW